MSYSSGYTGLLFEEEVLGRCRATARGYMKWSEALHFARANQPAQKTPTMRQLERTVRELTGTAATFYTAVRTPLDLYHGVDGWFEFRGAVVTLDVTRNPHKDSGKAHLIVHEDDVGDLAALAGRIARELGMQLSRRG